MRHHLSNYSPDRGETSEVDSQIFYYDNHRSFFAAMSVAVAWGSSVYSVMFGQLDPIFVGSYGFSTEV